MTYQIFWSNLTTFPDVTCTYKKDPLMISLMLIRLMRKVDFSIKICHRISLLLLMIKLNTWSLQFQTGYLASLERWCCLKIWRIQLLWRYVDFSDLSYSRCDQNHILLFWWNLFEWLRWFFTVLTLKLCHLIHIIWGFWCQSCQYFKRMLQRYFDLGRNFILHFWIWCWT